MKQQAWRQKAAKLLALLCALALLATSALAEDAEEAYVENEWNFVDESMDVTDGIPQDAVGVLERIREAGKLRVATEPFFPPQEFIDPSREGQEKYVGADMEMARLIAQRMGVELEIVPMEFTQVLAAVSDGECDLAISALSYTPGRAAAVELSKGYYYSQSSASVGIIIREAGKDRITGINDLWDKVIVAQSGSLQEALTADSVTAYREFRRLSFIQEVYQALEDGWADAAAVDLETAQAYIGNHPDSRLMAVPGIQFTLEKHFQGDRVAAKKGEIQLMYFVNGVIDELLASGQYQAWYQEYEALAAALE
ncbi:MAG: amino acid ABC transporter substrate-binding protein [Clostridia bacterium]|nr:amino acid ABC transporter substrate-binding protein [Clostridia bacterium]